MTNHQFNSAQLRRLLNQAFDDPSIDAFCQDYFPTVYDRFSRGMRKDEKITLLLDHCRRGLEGFKALKQAVSSEYGAGDPSRREFEALAEAVALLEQKSTQAGATIAVTPPDEAPVGESNVADEAAGRKDFFVSYNGKDKGWAEWIAWQLEEAGYTTIIQAWDFRPGGNFILDMQRAAEQAERTIAVLSENYLDALYTQPEWAVAFAQDPTGEKKALLPVRVQPCELKGMLAQRVYIDLVGKSETTAREELLAGLRVGRAKPVTAPGFPGGPGIQHIQPEKPSFPST